MLVSIVVKKVINHLNVQNPKRLVVVVAAVVVVNRVSFDMMRNEKM
jgi:hypothetical protein